VPAKLTTLEYLERQINGSLPAGATTTLHYPTPISTLLGIRIATIGEGEACLEMRVDASIHGNQQGTVHGGLLSELADAAIGTARSTLIGERESFTSIDLCIKFFRPVWKAVLTATAKPVQRGKTITHYQCEIMSEDRKVVALATGSVMTLRGAAAEGR